MKIHSCIAVMVLSYAFHAVQPARAELPTLEVAPWFGFFAGEKHSRGLFGVSTRGEIFFNPVEDASSAAGGWSFRMRPVIEEITPDGRVVVRDLEFDTLESSQTAASKLGKVVFSGTVKGGAKLEVTVEQNRGSFLIGGRVADPGPGKNLKRFALIGRAPRFYAPYEAVKKTLSGEEKELQEKREKALEKRVEKEHLEMKLMNGKVVKQPILEPADLESAELSGAGIAELGMDFQLFRGNKIVLTASPNSAFALKLEKDARIFKRGFAIYWRPDPAKDADGKARMAVTIR